MIRNLAYAFSQCIKMKNWTPFKVLKNPEVNSDCSMLIFWRNSRKTICSSKYTYTPLHMFLRIKRKNRKPKKSYCSAPKLRSLKIPTGFLRLILVDLNLQRAKDRPNFLPFLFCQGCHLLFRMQSECLSYDASVRSNKIF